MGLEFDATVRGRGVIEWGWRGKCTLYAWLRLLWHGKEKEGGKRRLELRSN